MQITVNGNSYKIDKELSVEQILKELQVIQEQGVAVALNYTVLSKAQFGKTYLQDGDKLDIIRATAGG